MPFCAPARLSGVAVWGALLGEVPPAMLGCMLFVEALGDRWKEGAVHSNADCVEHRCGEKIPSVGVLHKEAPRAFHFFHDDLRRV